MRDLVTWPKAMIHEIERYKGLQEIILLDNASTYPPLLDFYRQTPHRVVKMPWNVGHTAPWTPTGRAYLAIKTEDYVVTDPDLDLEGVPDDVLLHLAHILHRRPALGKVGLSLEFDDVSPDQPAYPLSSRYEPFYWSMPVIDGIYREAPIDTTFAMYNARILDQYKICGARTLRPYTARHLPWYVRTPDDEFAYYLAHASHSSSFKAFLDTGHKH